MRIQNQKALTDGAPGDARILSCPHSLVLLLSKASKNLDPSEAPAVLLQAWSEGNRWLKHTFWVQILQVVVFENVRTCLHRLTGHLGFFLLEGLQSPDLTCCSKITFHA